MDAKARTWFWRTAACVLLWLWSPGCADVSAPRPSTRQTVISDQLHNGGTQGFVFLPPMVPRPAYFGDFLPDLDPIVRVDEIRADGSTVRTLATFTRDDGPFRERIRVHLQGRPCDDDDDDGDTDPNGYFYARWFTHHAHLSPAAHYRVRVFVRERIHPCTRPGWGRRCRPGEGNTSTTREIGFADVAVVRNAHEFRGVDRDDYVPLINGHVLRVKFRIDRPVVDPDRDGVYSWRDNCPTVANANQRDTDLDGEGDACECGDIACAPSDACHPAGVCNPTTGMCTSPVSPDGTACALAHAAAACRAGVCRATRCDAGWADCDGDTRNGCETSATTTTHCGACGIPCAAVAHSVPTCATGSCGYTCEVGWHDADGNRANGCELDITTNTDCGRPGNACVSDTSGTSTCVGGACSTMACATGRANCNASIADGCEVNTQTDVAHCGGCGRACSVSHATPTCAGGTCAVARCDTGFADCDRDPSNGCEVNTDEDLLHCGVCNQACSLDHATATCTAGACAITGCAPGFADANQSATDGCEVNLATDPRHCGALNNACSTPNATAGCVARACVIVNCNANFADCDASPANGCEVDTTRDTSHCGACHRACPSGAHSAATCNGACGLTCDAGFADCDANPANGCEVDATRDRANCGGCAVACAASETCQSGRCSAPVCTAPAADCDGLGANGCEVDTHRAVAHCGACNRACAFDHAAPECTLGVCGFSVCDVGFADVDGTQSNGCEVNLATDVRHCGAVNHTCSTANGVASCDAGVCAIACRAGHADCNHDADDGCEAQTESDPNHCGGCNTACASGSTCRAGVCHAPSAQGHIDAGTNHTCAVHDDGSVWCWGNGTNGQLGNGTLAISNGPVQVSGLTNVTRVGVSDNHSCALKNDGVVWCWGANGSGQLGDGTTTQRTAPVQVLGLTDATQVAAGGPHTCALRNDGTVWCWGSNVYRQLGDGTTTQRTTPVQVMGLSDATRVATGDLHTCALRNDGTVWCWGSNDYGQSGDGTTTSRASPVQVVGLTDVTHVAAGGTHTCALRNDGTVWCWGLNGYGQLGDGTTTQRTSPVQVVGLTDAAWVTVGANHTCVVRGDGTGACWGDNFYGQIGDGTTVGRTSPTAVAGLTGAVEMTAGANHTCAMHGDGTARCWGSFALNQLGTGALGKSSTPVLVPSTSMNLASLGESSFDHTCATRADGSVQCWGNNVHGQLGDATASARFAPVLVVWLSGMTQTAAGTNFAFALHEDRLLRCWGANWEGQLGVGSTLSSTTPVNLWSLGEVAQVSAGGVHACAVQRGGLVWCWGYNGFGQLGDGTTTRRTSPVQVTDLTSAAQVATGSHHTCALRNSGEVWCWGYNGFGQRGDGTTSPSATPVRVVGLPDATHIALGDDHSCAVRSNGTVWCWGNGSGGKLGNGTTTSNVYPVQVSGLTDVAQVSAGNSHACARKNDGTVWCWGSNGDGQLGDGTYTQRNTPVQVTGLSNVTQISTGFAYSCALRNDGTAWCWGLNATSQLGEVAPYPRLPARVRAPF